MRTPPAHPDDEPASATTVVRAPAQPGIWPHAAVVLISAAMVVMALVFWSVWRDDQDGIGKADETAQCRDRIAADLQVGLGLHSAAIGHLVDDLAAQRDNTASLARLRDAADRLDEAIRRRDQTDELCRTGGG